MLQEVLAPIAKQLAQAGASLLLADRNEAQLTALIAQLPGKHTPVVADLSSDAGRGSVLTACQGLANGLDILINSAGAMDFSFIEKVNPERLDMMMQVNVMMPILLTQTVLPLLKKQPTATAIVNIGSTFGSIGYPGFSAYCTSKFALRGFTETLRRELSQDNVSVIYVAPRATQTALNSDAITEMNKALKNSMDSPEKVASIVVNAIKKQTASTFIGWPEKLFVKMNGLLPNLVDNALKKQLSTIREFSQK